MFIILALVVILVVILAVVAMLAKDKLPFIPEGKSEVEKLNESVSGQWESSIMHPEVQSYNKSTTGAKSASGEDRELLNKAVSSGSN